MIMSTEFRRFIIRTHTHFRRGSETLEAVDVFVCIFPEFQALLDLRPLAFWKNRINRLNYTSPTHLLFRIPPRTTDKSCNKDL